MAWAERIQVLNFLKSCCFVKLYKRKRTVEVGNIELIQEEELVSPDLCTSCADSIDTKLVAKL